MLAFVFPGQGSQKAGMGKALCERFAVARRVFEEADQALGFALSKLCFEGPDAELQLTANSQPALVTMSTAVLRAVQETTGRVPSYVAGHSLGEYSALVCAGAIDFADAVRTARRRGQHMQAAVPAGEGAMAAVMGMSAGDVEQLCRDAAQGRVLSPANYNGPAQTVIAGHKDAVERAKELAGSRGGKAAMLAVSAPFHCALMQPAAVALAEDLQKLHFRDLAMPLVCNVDAEPNRDGARVAELLVRQVTAPVQWEASVKKLAALGVTEALEVGAGRTLTGLIKRIEPALKTTPVEDPTQLA